MHRTNNLTTFTDLKNLRASNFWIPRAWAAIIVPVAFMALHFNLKTNRSASAWPIQIRPTAYTSSKYLHDVVWFIRIGTCCIAWQQFLSMYRTTVRSESHANPRNELNMDASEGSVHSVVHTNGCHIRQLLYSNRRYYPWYNISFLISSSDEK